MKSYLLILTVLLSAMFAAPFYSHADSKAGHVLIVRKNVYIIRADKKNPAKPQMELFENDAVETDTGSRTKLFFIDDSILSLGEMSRVEVQEYMYSPEKQRSKSIYRLMDGALKVVVGRSDLEIHTPTAVAAARGTKFMVMLQRVAGTLVTRIMVFEGEVMVKSIIEGIKGMVIVPANKMTEVPENKPPEKIKTLDPTAMNKTTVVGDIVSPDTELPDQLHVPPVSAVPDVPSVPPVFQQVPDGAQTPAPAAPPAPPAPPVEAPGYGEECCSIN